MLLPGPGVIVVTGASTGIGFHVVQDLVKSYDGTIYLTCQNETRGNQAVESIKQMYENETIPTNRYFTEKIKFYKVDVTSQADVENFTQHVRDTHGGVNILINNAAVNLDHVGHLTREEKINKTLETNYFGLLRMCHFLFPLLRQSAKVIHVTSQVGHVRQIANGTLRMRFMDEEMTEGELSELMHEYVRDVNNGTHREKGWPDSPYTVSKVGISKLAMVQHRQYFFHNWTADIAVNAVNPGYAQTAMSNYTGIMTADEAGDSILWLTDISPFIADPKGRLIWNNREIAPWNDTIMRTFDHPSKCVKYW